MANPSLNEQVSGARKAFAEHAKGVHGELFRSVTKACLLVEADAKRLMTETEIDESKSYGKRQHHPSEPFSPPAVDMGLVRRSVDHKVVQDGSKVTGYVGSTIVSPPIGFFLEHGTSRMLMRPWLRPAIARNREEIHKIIGEAVRGRSVALGSDHRTGSLEAQNAAG